MDERIEKNFALIVVLAMIASVAGFMLNGIDQGIGLLLLITFSVTFSMAAVLFEGWSEKEE